MKYQARVLNTTYVVEAPNKKGVLHIDSNGNFLNFWEGEELSKIPYAGNQFEADLDIRWREELTGLEALNNTHLTRELLREGFLNNQNNYKTHDWAIEKANDVKLGAGKEWKLVIFLTIDKMPSNLLCKNWGYQQSHA